MEARRGCHLPKVAELISYGAEIGVQAPRLQSTVLGLWIVLLSDAPEACEVSFATWYLPLSASFLSSDVILEAFSGGINSALKP